VVQEGQKARYPVELKNLLGVFMAKIDERNALQKNLALQMEKSKRGKRKAENNFARDGPLIEKNGLPPDGEPQEAQELAKKVENRKETISSIGDRLDQLREERRRGFASKEEIAKFCSAYAGFSIPSQQRSDGALKQNSWAARACRRCNLREWVEIAPIS